MKQKKKHVPFYPQFSFTPKWKDNRQRDVAEQFRVDLRDLPEGRRIAKAHGLANIAMGQPSGEGDPKSQLDAALETATARVKFCEELVEKHLIAIHNLAIVAENGEDVIEVKTFAQLRELAQDAVIEIAERLLHGPDADEIKNS